MAAALDLPPGFRFHPTDEELVIHYLCRKCASQPIGVPIIAEIDLYKYDPWDLPGEFIFALFKSKGFTDIFRGKITIASCIYRFGSVWRKGLVLLFT